jgi:hypothetical protein
MTVDIDSDPPPEQIVPGVSLARVTLKASWQGKPLERGHLKLRLVAPRRSGWLLPRLPHLEGTELLQLESGLRDGTFSFQYRFPMPGAYGVELELTPVPGGEGFSPTTLHRRLQVHGDPAEGWFPWLLLGSLFALGVIAGSLCSRQAKARTKPSPVAAVVSVLGFCHALALLHTAPVEADHAVNTQVTFPRGPQVIKGNAGWELAVRPTPLQARVGEPLQLAIQVRKDGQIYAQATEVSLNVYQLAADIPVLRAHIVAPAGSISPRVQLFDSAPHTCTVTARPAAGNVAESVGLVAVLGLDVGAQPHFMEGKLHLLAISVGVLGGGMVAGLLLPRITREARHV